tara:strand:+ start:42 stop:326 length:285 start_codon:yes stop_codon:yes gene_type:complete
MPLYPVVNLKTREKKDLHMLVEEYEKWRKENPDWDKDWSQGCGGFRTRDASHYHTDAIADDTAYEDKNNSRTQVDTADLSSAPTNQQIKDKYGW